MENTKENKKAFLAQYFGQNILCNDGHDVKNLTIDGFTLSAGSHPTDYLSLKPLSSISDEDAIEVAKMYWGNNYSEFPLKTDKIAHSRLILPTMATRTDIADYLRSKSYALPFMGLSVETLVEYGWVKLINGEL